MPKELTVKYKCACMQDEGSLTMKARRHGEDIDDFMGRLQRELGRDHAARNPLCRADKVEFVKVPLDEESGQVGGAG